MNRPDPTPPPKPGILVVDDEPGVRNLLSRWLMAQGFPVWLACGGQESVEMFPTLAQAIRLVFLDVEMPGLDGPQTLRILKHINPSLRCCLMSGGRGNYSKDELRQLGAERFFPKPFPFAEISEYLQTLRHALAASS